MSSTGIMSGTGMTVGGSLSGERIDRSRRTGRITQFWLVRALMVLAVIAWASTIGRGLITLFHALNLVH
jgi:hypothetical protein